MSSIEASYYENREFWTGELFDEIERARFDFVISRIDPGVRSLLDVGCGNGLFLKRVREARPDITVLHGVDRSAAALAHVDAGRTQSSIDALPMDDASFDCVTCLEVIEHLPASVFSGALRHLARVPKQQLILSVPKDQDLSVGRVECPACRTLFNPDYHLHSFNDAKLSGLFEQQGWRAREVTSFGVSEEYLLVTQIDAFKRHRPNRFAQDVPCPVCGVVLPGTGVMPTATPAPAAPKRRSARGMIKQLWPKVRTPRWLLADYRRHEPAKNGPRA
jgi:SAM-dependent methyltransferase